MSGLTKEVTATCGKTILVVGLSNKDEVMYVKSTIRVKPKNRKQKKEFKSQSYRMRKVAKGEYEVTTYCPFNVKLFSKIMSILEKNENGEFWFNIDKSKCMNKLEYIPGDLVMVDNDIVKVMTRGVNYFLKIINNYDVMFHSGNVYKYSPNELKPIPLTQEILEKNGWKLINGFYWSPNEEGAVVGLTSQTGYVWNAYMRSYPLRSGINSVSDLQHLLFGLGLNSEMEV